VKRARFTREARAEFLAQVAFYERVRSGLGARFRKEIENAAQLAATWPQHGRPGPSGTRRRLVADFPFKLIYTETDDGILIHAVASDHQLPDYWVSRTGRREQG
jgi:plasmid stabilization system protein ParE